MPEGATITGVFRRPFKEQVAAFRLRLQDLVPTARWDDITRNAHDRAFMVAGAAKADLLADLAAAVDRSIAEGAGFERFKADFRGIVEKHGWHGWTGEGTAAGEAWRMRTIYRTNMATSYAAGRFAQLKKAGFKYWVYRHGGSEHPRLWHLAWDGLILPADHPFWQTHYPPNGWGCSCYVTGARSIEGAKRVGGDPSVSLPDNWREIDPKTGAPLGIGKLWDYAPGSSMQNTIAIGASKLREMPALIGADFAEGLSGIIDRAWPMWIAAIKEERNHHAPALAGSLRPAVIKDLETRGRAPVSAEIMVKPGLVVGPKANRHATKGDAFTEHEWLTLPSRLREPIAILFDPRTGRLLYVLPGDDGASQMVVALDYWEKGRDRERRQMNLARSAYHPVMRTLRDRVRAGQLEIILGSLE
jgi:hypothetical protein